jgi:hypothetical protein
MRLTLRTLLAYLDDTLHPAEARQIGLKVAENPPAQELVDRIKRVTRRRGLATPPTGTEGSPSDPNTVAEYISDALPADQVAQFEKTCLESDVHLAEIAACHQILTLVLSEQVRVPPTARRRMYQLVKGRESVPDRKPGRTIPVGGVIADEKPAVPDDTDAPFLLGMSAYSRSDSWSRTATRLATLAVLLVGLGVALWMAIPSAAQPRREEAASAAYTVASVPAGPPGGTDAAKPRPPEKVEPKPDEGNAKPPEKSEVKPPESDLNPQEQAPAPRKPGEPLVPAGPETELAPKDLPPRGERVPVGKLEKTSAVVVRYQPQMEGWFRIPPDDANVTAGDRLICLPGYKSDLRLGDVAVDLWGNLPELFRSPVPLLEASVTPHLPYDGYHADLTVHAGRVYLTAKRPTGGRVKLRLSNQVWDLTLADDKSEVVVEVAHTLVPGARQEPPQTRVLLAVLTGQATLKPSRYKEAVKLTKGGEASWDSKGGRPEVRADPGEEARGAQAAYLSRLQPYFDAPRAKLALEALDDFARKLTDSRRVRATFDEALQGRADAPTAPKDVVAARIAVLVFAALGDLPGLADALSDPSRPLLRQTAVEGLRAALARDPDLAEPFRHTLVDKLQVDDDQAKAALRLLRGFTDKELTDPATLDRLVGGLSSNAVCVRELSFQHLLGMIDPSDPASRPLLAYDPGAAADMREPAAQAWRKKVEELKKKKPEPAPPPEPPKM